MDRVEYNHEWRRANPERALLRQAKDSAKHRGWQFNLDLSDIIIPDVCPIFGFPLVWKPKRSGTRTDNHPSIDRVDSTKGYVKGNVWVISWRANRLKFDASLTELEALVAAVGKRLGLEEY